MEGLPKDVFEYLLTWLDPHALSNARLGSSRVYRACIKPIFQRNYVNAQPVIAWKVWMQEWFTASEYILLQQWVPVLLQRPDVWDCRTYWMTDDDDETLLYPLLCASRAGAPCITQLLASPGVDVIDQFYFDSAIVAAANAGNTMCLRILLSEPRAHINVENISEHALSPACRNGRLKVVEILLESRRRIPLRTLTQSRRLQSDALMAACSTGRVEIVSLLLRHPDIDVNGYYMDSAIGIAIDNMQIEVCRLLLQDKRLRVERQGSSLMAKALRTDCIELVELLIRTEKLEGLRHQWPQFALKTRTCACCDFCYSIHSGCALKLTKTHWQYTWQWLVNSTKCWNCCFPMARLIQRQTTMLLLTWLKAAATNAPLTCSWQIQEYGHIKELAFRMQFWVSGAQ
jgi:hypothetical protein